MQQPASITLGLRANWRQFVLLVIINAFSGGMVGLERTILPLLAEQDFGLTSKMVILSFLVSFGIVKALTNLFAGWMGDRFGRKRVLVAGWLIGLPVPFLVILAPTWGWVIFANVLLGINQGLGSMTVIMKIDLVGSRQRGRALGFNEASGYLAVSGAALAAGYLATAYALRPQPLFLGVAFALCGFVLSCFFVRESHAYAGLEAEQAQKTEPDGALRTVSPSFSKIVTMTSWKNRSLFAVCQAGLVNNLNDGLSWGLFPLYFVAAGLDTAHISLLVAVYPAIWGVGQLVTGALSDHLGRKGLIVMGMWIQAVGLFLILATHVFWFWLLGAVLLGGGTALVYPTLLAAVSDVAHPTFRASTVGIYRLWRDSGYAVGAILSGVIADLFGIPWAIGTVSALTALSGIAVAVLMRETLIMRNIRAPQGTD